MSKTIYLAYGSNMSVEQMAHRCPDATFLKITTLPGFKFEFKGEVNRSYATIVPEEQASIPVMLWEISESDEVELDKYEDYPDFYGKEYLTVDGMKVMYYYMQPQYSYGIPADTYYQTIENAYLKYDLDVMILKEALAESERHLASN